MFKKLNKMKIGARLKKSFRQIILIFGILSALVVVIMLYTINNYGTILDNYAYPQGDIAMAMNESAEVRAASRGIVGYDSDSLIESMKEQHEQAVKSFEEYLEKIRPTMITKEGTACMDAIDKAWAEYKEVDAKVIEVGATTDTAKSLQAQRMMTDEAAPKYQALDDALQKLMALNISLGNAKRAQLRTVMIAALTIIIIVIAVSTIYSNSLSVAISKSIEKPLNELKDRFITFAEGDIDSPLPTVESEDEIKELVSGVSAMSDRIRVIIKDSGRMLNEMSEGNFAIDTECEEAQEIVEENSKLSMDDPKYAANEAKIKELYEKALPFYEKAKEVKPDNRQLWGQYLLNIYWKLDKEKYNALEKELGY